MISERHVTSTFLGDLILGGQDGMVNVLGIVLGVTAASGSHQIIIAASLAAAFAEAISMAAVAYTSAMAEKDHYQSELNRELSEIATVPDTEKEEIRQVYAAKGFKSDLLEKIVETITSDQDVWLKTMMKEELGLEVIDTKAVVRSSVVVGVAALLGSFVPIWPFFFFPQQTAVILCLASSTVALFVVGFYKAKTFVGNPVKSGVQMLIIGLGAAFVGFLIGRLFNVT